MLQMCTECGMIRESDIPLGCARHFRFGPMIEVTIDTPTYLGKTTPNPFFDKTSADRGMAYLDWLGPEYVVAMVD